MGAGTAVTALLPPPVAPRLFGTMRFHLFARNPNRRRRARTFTRRTVVRPLLAARAFGARAFVLGRASPTSAAATTGGSVWVGRHRIQSVFTLKGHDIEIQLSAFGTGAHQLDPEVLSHRHPSSGGV